MKNVIKTFVLAILAMAFTAFPAVAADQTKQVKKPQVQKVSSEQRLAADQKFVREYTSGLAKSTCYPNCPKQKNPPPNLFKAYLNKK